MPNTKHVLASKPKTFLLLSLTGLSTLLTGCVSNQFISPSSHNKSVVVSEGKTNKKAYSPDVTPDTLNLDIQAEPHHSIVWSAMRNKFHLADQYHGKYQEKLAFYTKRKTHLKKVSQRAKPYLHYILTEVQKRNMPYEMALLPIVESGFRPVVQSSQKAMGLWQFIPSTGDIYNLKRNWWYDGRKDVVKSTQAALDYLEKLYGHNNNDWLLALASYNAGLGNVYKAQRKYRKVHKNTPGIKEYQPNFWEIQPYLPRETQAYVPKLLAVSYMVDNSERLGIELEPIDNEPFFTQIALDKQVSLHQVARISDTPNHLLAQLNPAYHQPATPPNGPHHILLPVAKADAFSTHIENNKDIFKIQWQRHKIKAGDSLSVIAQTYKTSSRAIKKLNGMKTAKIRAGKTLLIPIPSDNTTPGLQTAHPTQYASKEVRKETQTVTAVSTAQTKQQVHIVKQGDSLWKLAKTYHVSTKDITKWNKLSSKKPLRIGQKIAIHTQPLGQKIEHTLKSGESLWSLAQRYKVTTKQIAAWNSISTKKTLQPGMKLTVWTSLEATQYTVKTGDNLWNIAKANQVSAKQLAQHNKLSLKSLLKPGQVLQIPLES